MATTEETAVAMNVTEETAVTIIEETAVEIEVTTAPTLPPVAEDCVETKKPKKVAAPKKSRSSPTHPPFLEMITEAIVSLKEKTGSSQYAITKFIEENHKNLPSNFRKLLLGHLKKLVASGKLVKVKNSYKIPSKPVSASSGRAKPNPSTSPKAGTAATKASKPKAKTVSKPKTRPTVAKPKPKAPLKAKSVVAKPKPKTTLKAKPVSVVAKPKPKTTLKAKPVAAKPKVVSTSRPKKVAKTATKASPGKKTKTVTKPAAASKVKKAPLSRSVKKPVSVKTPVKKAQAKRGKK